MAIVRRSNCAGESATKTQILPALTLQQLRKTLLIMKFTAFLMIVCSFELSAKGFGQTITLNLENVPIQQAFVEIEKQSGYSFVYGKEQVSQLKITKLSVTQASIEQVLTKLFTDQPLAYTISGKYISIKRLPAAEKTTVVAPPPIEVKGKLVSDKGEPLEGITVTVKSTKLATQTNADGTFSINAPSEKSVLIFSGVGYGTKEVAVNGRTDIGSVSLVVSNTNLNDVVVTGYSSQRRKDITGAVSVVNTVDLKSVPAANATSQLQGRASGVTVLQNGTPGVQAQVKIRGLGSFSNNNPLYVIDGVQTYDISSLASEDIESMQVLKDAASASIYGVRSSNGVIVITTKKGRRGLNVSYNMTYGVQLAGKGPDYTLSPEEQAQLVFLVQKNQGLSTVGTVYGDGATPVLPDYLFAGYSGTNPPSGPINEGNPITDPSLYSLDPTRIGDPGYVPYIIVKANKAGTDWWGLATRNGPIQNHNVTLSTANDRSRFLLSLNYFDQKAITIYQFYKRFNVRLNSEFSVFKGIRIGENLNLAVSSANVQGNSTGGNQSNNQEASDFGAISGEAKIVPVYTINGRDFAGSAGGFGGSNPIATLYRKKDNRDNNTNILGNIYGEADILKHFTFRSSFGGYLNTQNTITNPLIEYENSLNRNVRTLSEGWNRSTRWIWTNQLSYKNEFGKHTIFALIGTEASKDEGRQVNASATGFYTFAYPDYLVLQNGGQPNLAGSTKYIPVTTSSLFANVNYEYDGRYLLSALIRRDGSSKFSDSNKYGVFPAVSLGWRISNEGFMRNVSWLNDLKIRGSYGVSGNEIAVKPDNIYTTYASSPGSSYYDIQGSQTNPDQGFYNNFVGNVKAKWEKDYSTNVGFDMTFLNNSTTLIFDWYEKRTEGLLFNQGGQGLLGEAPAFNPAYSNVGGMKNWGIDIMATNRARFGELSLTSTVTFTTYKNKITSIAEGVPYFDFNSPSNEKNRLNGETITRNMVGQPFNTYYGYKVLGIFQNQAQVDAAPVQDGGTGSNTAAPGTFIYEDISGPDGKPDHVIDQFDRQIIGNPNPKFSYGINLDFEYKGFDLSAFFYGVSGKQNYNWGKWFQDFNSNFGGASKNGLYDSWLPDGSRPNAKVPMQTSTTTFSTASVVNSYFVENASYFRLRNLQIGYTFNSHVLSKIKLTRARIYLQATNVFTITKYSGMDPEVVTNAEGATGIDLGTYPTVRQISFGANIVF